MPKVTRQAPPANKKAASRGSSVLDRIAPIQMPDRGLQVAIYGRSGTGKTTLAATFPKPLLLVRPPDDDGRLSIYNVSGIDDAPIYSLDEMEELLPLMASGKYATVVLDNASALQDLVMKKVLGLEEIPTQLSWGVADQSQWGEIGLAMKEILRRLLDLTCNTVVLAQEREFNADANVTDFLTPYVNCGLSPSVASWIGPKVNYLCNTFIREVEELYESNQVVHNKKVKLKRKVIQYCLRTGPHPVYNTKFRVPMGTPLPELIVNPTYDKILKLIRGGK